MYAHPSGISSANIGSSSFTLSPGIDSEAKSGNNSGCKISIALASHPLTPPTIRSCLDSGNGIAFNDSSDSTALPFVVPNGSIIDSSIMLISDGTHSSGRSRNQGLCGGGNDVLKRRATSLVSSQLSCIFVNALCQFLRI